VVGQAAAVRLKLLHALPAEAAASRGQRPAGLNRLLVRAAAEETAAAS
jgi:hypothetical protein